MDSRTFSVQQVFEDRRQYRVPFYQRSYVWSREAQWNPLWEDIRDKADARLAGAKPVPHFLGAVVLEPQRKPGLIGVERHHIIDGQQRLTTLQYVLTALYLAFRELDEQQLLPLIQACLVNDNPRTMEEPAIERFKLWPTFRDRKQYEQAMTADSAADFKTRFPDSFTQAGSLRKIGAVHPPALEAILFFYEEMLAWLKDSREEGTTDRPMALASAILKDLSIVCILLGDEDDAQIIFETLNGRGAELHATDLIRNFIFMRAGNDADQLYDSLWTQFEVPTWSELQSRGRLSRPRLEWFVQTAVQAQTGDEVEIGRLYTAYRKFVDADANLRPAAAQLGMLNKFADHYKALVTGVGNTPIAQFGRRVAVWDASPTHPLALRVATSALSDDEQVAMFACIESYLVRRAVCGLTRKSYNKVFQQQLKSLISDNLDLTTLLESLSAVSGESSRWPTDDEFRRELREGPLYPGRLDAAKMRSLLHRLETALRSERSEERILLDLDSLDIDHVMPQAWTAYWPLADGVKATADEINQVFSLQLIGEKLSPRAAAVAARGAAISRLGNLTMLHLGVNRAAQNKEFSIKRELLIEHSNLQLNRPFMKRTDWDEEGIAARGKDLAEVALSLWRGPQ